MRSIPLLAALLTASAFACGGSHAKATSTTPETAAATAPATPAAAAPATKPAEPAPAAPAKTLAAKIEDTNKAMIAAWNAHDPDKVAATYSADGVLKYAPAPDMPGRDQIKAQAVGTLTAYPDFKVGVVRAITKDHTSILEWVCTGTNTGDGPRGKATKRAIGLHGVEVETFDDDGLIKESHRYFDDPTQMMQLDAKAKAGTFRSVAELPSGEPAMVASAGSPDEQKNLDAVNALYKAIDDHKAPAALAALSPDLQGEDYSQPAAKKGTKAAKAYLASLFKAVPDVKQDRTTQFAAGDLVVTEGVLHGTLKGKFGSLKPTHKPIGLHFVDICQVKDGKIVAITTYANSGELMPPPREKAPAKPAKAEKEPGKAGKAAKATK